LPIISPTLYPWFPAKHFQSAAKKILLVERGNISADGSEPAL
jgi:hypothetical protein